VVPIHNRLEELKELLSSLNVLNVDGGIELSIKIVDDASKDPITGESLK
jgi:hypothetical protein